MKSIDDHPLSGTPDPFLHFVIYLESTFKQDGRDNISISHSLPHHSTGYYMCDITDGENTVYVLYKESSGFEELDIEGRWDDVILGQIRAAIAVNSN